MGTITLLNVERPCLDVAATFQRLYVCLAAIRTDFKEGCKPLIGLDGCFLKESYKGHLLSVDSRDPTEPSNPYRFSKLDTNIKCSVCEKFGYNSRTCPLAKKKKSKIGSKVLYLIITLSLFNYLYTCCMVLMYYMLLQKGRKKCAITMSAGTSKKGAIIVGARTSGQAATCGRLASAGGVTGSAAGGNGVSLSGSGASRKAKVVVVPTVKKAMVRIVAKK